MRERVPNPDRIHIEVDRGEVVLCGEVDQLPLKSMAAEAAESVRGVHSVTNDITIAAEKRSDEEIARDVYWTLHSDPATLALGADVAVRDGVVTLSGTVDTFPERRIAEWVASGVRGVREITNRIRVDPEKRTDREIHDDLLQHYASSPMFNDDHIDVQVHDGVVSLTGEVDRALERNWARADAWTRGVREVHADSLGVALEPLRSPTGRSRSITDGEIRAAIVKELAYDPRVASVNIEVTVERGAAPLRGTVGKGRAKRAAVEIARNTGGVAQVVDRLNVRSAKPIADPEIVSAVLQAIRTSAALQENAVTLTVHDGHVVLNGTVDSAYERWAAQDLAERTAGVADVENNLAVKGGSSRSAQSAYFYPRANADTPWVFSRAAPDGKSDEQLASAVREELAWSPFVDAEDIRVKARNGIVTPEGQIDSWSERSAAIENAYEAGAREVISELSLAPHK